MTIYIHMTVNGVLGRDTKPHNSADDAYEGCFIEDDATGQSKKVRLKPYWATNFSTVFIERATVGSTCSECNTPPVSCGKPLTFNLDHIKGDLRDDRLTNLRLLCPNCRSQQPMKRPCIPLGFTDRNATGRDCFAHLVQRTRAPCQAAGHQEWPGPRRSVVG